MNLIPDYYYKKIEEIPREFFERIGVKGLILDIDNTLTQDGSPDVEKTVEDWVKGLCDFGIKAVIISNNDAERASPFAKRLELPFVAKALKPKLGGFLKALEIMGIERGETAVIGDQLFTDILLAKRANCRSFLVDPVGDDKFPFVRVKRFFERPVKRKIIKVFGEKNDE